MKILIILASGIGNSILFSPTLIALRKEYPKSTIDIFAYEKAFAEPFKGSRLIDEVFYYEGFKTLRILRKRSYDVSITAFPSNKWQFNLFAFLVGAKKRITHSYKKGITLAFLQNCKVPANENLHDVDQNLSLLTQLNLKTPKNKQLLFYTGRENEKFAEKFIQNHKLSSKNIIGIHPGSGPLEYKRSPLDKFIELVNKNSKSNSVILIFGTKDEDGVRNQLRDSLKQKSFIINADLKDTAALIKKCNLFITNDTGLMHIASTSPKTKIIALFNGTNPSRTKQYTNNAQIIVLRRNMMTYPFGGTR